MQADPVLIAGADRQRMLVRALQNPAAYPHPAAAVTLLETHSAYVLLTGGFAYKIKKAINLGFLDFSSLEQRRFYCGEELRLNRRLAPELYLAVVPVGGTREAPRVGDREAPAGQAECLEYAVKMLEFPQSALFDRRLSAGALLPVEIDALADRVAGFHAQAARAGPGDDYGLPAAVWAPVAENFAQLRVGLDNSRDLDLLDTLESWSSDEYRRREALLTLRQRNGFVRECHGDLHLGNIVRLHGMPQLFDCIEFNANLRWIDVLSEVAFLVMDLEERGRADYAHRLLDRYLEATGDYAGLPVLPFYRVYRALVRAKVAGIRATQEAPQAAQQAGATRAQYLQCARRATRPLTPRLLLMHGVSGSGKTWVSQALLERLGALRLRSDIERKRLCGLPALARSGSAIDRGLYDPDATRATYLRLVQLAQMILQAGFPVIIDAASLKYWQRKIFRSLAEALHVPFRMISCHAAETTLAQRLLARERAGADASDAGIAILRHQQQRSDPLSPAEQSESIRFDSEHDSVAHIFQQMGVPPAER